MMRWLRHRPLPVGDVPLEDTYYMAAPGAEVTEVRLGRADGLEVFATCAAPRRWFVLFRAADMPGGIYGEIVWEVDPAADVGGLRRRRRGDADAAPIIAGHLDVPLYRDRAEAARSGRMGR
jgi:hypothetical protein